MLEMLNGLFKIIVEDRRCRRGRSGKIAGGACAGNGILFEGEDGRILVNRGKLAGKPVEDMTKAEQKTLDEIELIKIACANAERAHAAIAEGQVSYRPGHNKMVDEEKIEWTRIEDMALLFEYCWSPFRNPAGVEFVDCAILSDPAQWDASYLDD